MTICNNRFITGHTSSLLSLLLLIITITIKVRIKVTLLADHAVKTICWRLVPEACSAISLKSGNDKCYRLAATAILQRINSPIGIIGPIGTGGIPGIIGIGTKPGTGGIPTAAAAAACVLGTGAELLVLLAPALPSSSIHSQTPTSMTTRHFSHKCRCNPALLSTF